MVAHSHFNANPTIKAFAKQNIRSMFCFQHQSLRQILK